MNLDHWREEAHRVKHQQRLLVLALKLLVILVVIAAGFAPWTMAGILLGVLVALTVFYWRDKKRQKKPPPP